VCVCVCMYVCVCVCVYIYIYIHTHAHTHTHVDNIEHAESLHPTRFHFLKRRTVARSHCSDKSARRILKTCGNNRWKRRCVCNPFGIGPRQIVCNPGASTIQITWAYPMFQCTRHRVICRPVPIRHCCDISPESSLLRVSLPAAGGPSLWSVLLMYK